MTKEELIKENAILKQQIEEMQSTMDTGIKVNEKIRTEFAKAFGWLKRRGMYDIEDHYDTPSWEQVFIEVGRLLANKDFRNFEGDIVTFEKNFETLFEELRKINSKD